ncbi:hypothetical protein U5A82_13520 [Sphingobium sp. CR2-8]|uniref:DUF3108 domain-containing protein n=1 Tax=Sphingobium sp. CR2-8 TaxID=1306534 RepID=UPI002DB5EF7C|nr:hypothetical protein [Sphingobium sp. CR2-8]MEC3911444.1 hypothetical protein [Sphingobium sp. CR2-8]
MQHRTITGKILYTSRKPERMGEERGRENFTFTVHADGKRILRAQCEIEEPSPTVLRDITYALDENDMPMDCFVRLTIGDRFMGAGLFIIRDGYVECESYGPSIGRLSQTVKIVGDYDGFGTHPIQGDAYITKKVDVSKGPHTHQLRTFLPSTDHRGATPPIIAEANMQLAYVGEETVTVAAGTFACRHFRFTDEHGGMASDKGAHPDYDLWVTADEDAIFVQGGVGGYMQTWYELVELTRS